MYIYLKYILKLNVNKVSQCGLALFQDPWLAILLRHWEDVLHTGQSKVEPIYVQSHQLRLQGGLLYSLNFLSKIVIEIGVGCYTGVGCWIDIYQTSVPSIIFEAVETCTFIYTHQTLITMTAGLTSGSEHSMGTSSMSATCRSSLCGTPVTMYASRPRIRFLIRFKVWGLYLRWVDTHIRWAWNRQYLFL